MSSGNGYTIGDILYIYIAQGIALGGTGEEEQKISNGEEEGGGSDS